MAEARDAAHVDVGVRRDLNPEAAAIARFLQQGTPIWVKRGVHLLPDSLVLVLDPAQLLADRGDGALDPRSFQRVGGLSLGKAAESLLVEAKLVFQARARRLQLAQPREAVRTAGVRGQLGAELLDDHRRPPRGLLLRSQDVT